MQAFASQAGLALARAASSVALTDALERERLVSRISLEVRSQHDLDELLGVTVAETAGAIGGDAVLHPPGRDGLEDGDRGGVERARCGAAHRRNTPACGQSGDAEQADDRDRRRDASVGAQRSRARRRPGAARSDVRAVLATPLLAGDRLLGVLSVQRSRPSAWSAADVALAEAVAREAATAVETARLLRESEQRLAEQGALLQAGQQQARSERGFYRIASVLSEPLSAEATLEAVAQAATDSLQGEAAAVFRPTGGTLELAARYSLPDELAPPLAGRGCPGAHADGRARARSSRHGRSPGTAASLRGSSRPRRLRDSGRCSRYPFRSRAARAGSRSSFSSASESSRTRSWSSPGTSPEPRGAPSSAASCTSSSAGRARWHSGWRRRAASCPASSIPRTCSTQVVQHAVDLLEADGASVRLLEDDELVVRAACGAGSRGVDGGAGAVDDVARRRHRPVALRQGVGRRERGHARLGGRPDARLGHRGVPRRADDLAGPVRPRRARRLLPAAPRVARGGVGGAPRARGQRSRGAHDRRALPGRQARAAAKRSDPRERRRRHRRRRPRRRRRALEPGGGAHHRRGRRRGARPEPGAGARTAARDRAGRPAAAAASSRSAAAPTRCGSR